MRGFFVNGKRLAACSRCGKRQLAWAKSRHGPYLVETERSPNGPGLYWAKPWAKHQCRPASG